MSRNRFKVTTEEIRPDTEEEPGCYAVRVGDRLLGFERNQLNADLRAKTLREVIRDARAAAFKEAERIFERERTESKTTPERPMPGK